MMIQRAAILLWAVSSALAAPAVVWKSSTQSSSALHSSKEVKAADIFGSVFDGDKPVAGVVFLLGRSDNGAESLSKFASEGQLPAVAGKYESASAIHHHVAGLDGSHVVAKVAKNAGHRALEVTLGEFSSKLAMMDETAEVEVDETGAVVGKSATKRARSLSNANLLVVKVPASTNPSEIDAAVVSAIENESIDTVVLAGVRSVDEVKHERAMLNRRRLSIMQEAGRRFLVTKSNRRLEDEAQGEGQDQQNNDNNDSSDMSGVYYVSMTPNILAGLLFTLLFAVVTFIAVSCMGMISGQDVYVSKMPSIGREA